MAQFDKLKLEKIKLLEAKLKHQKQLPHLYLHKHYKWSRQFFESRNKMVLCTAANQVGKSSVQIKKVIEWATNTSLWPELWPGRSPNLFFYLYPSKEIAEIEWKTKWLPLMPNGSYKDHPTWGWNEYKNKGLIDHVEFNSGILLSFRTYNQDVQNLQASSVFSLFCDEELPWELYDELRVRLSGVEGYYSQVFTATLGQEEWRLTMEPSEEEKNSGKEKFPSALKIQVSLFDCQKYEDGTEAQWNLDRIKTSMATCGSHTEILRRIYGKFVKSTGLVYEAFSSKECVTKSTPIPASWFVYAGIDSGSGGEKGDPAAIVFVGVKPDYSEGRVIQAWKGDGEVTTSTDILEKYIAMRKEFKVQLASYDYSDKDLYIIASRLGIGLVKADKSIDKGVNTVNALFKNRMLKLHDSDEGSLKLAQELSALGVDTPMRKRNDHLADALRYCVSAIPWDWSKARIQEQLTQEIVKPLGKTAAERQDAERRGIILQDVPRQYSVEDEFNEINALSGAYNEY